MVRSPVAVKYRSSESGQVAVACERAHSSRLARERCASFGSCCGPRLHHARLGQEEWAGRIALLGAMVEDSHVGSTLTAQRGASALETPSPAGLPAAHAAGRAGPSAAGLLSAARIAAATTSRSLQTWPKVAAICARSARSTASSASRHASVFVCRAFLAPFALSTLR